MIKFTRGLANQYLSTPDSPAGTYPNGDWCVGFVLTMDGPRSGYGGSPQYLLSNGGFTAANSLNIAFEPTDSINAPGTVHAYVDTSNSPVAQSVGTLAANTSYLFVLQRSGNTLSMRHCPILSVEPLDGSAVIQGTSTPLSIALDGGEICIGARSSDKDATRFFGQSAGRMFRYDGTLSNLEVAQLAYGKQITDLGKVPTWYLRMSDVSDITDRGSAGMVFTARGTLATSAEPAYGYSATTTPTTPVVTDTVTVVAPAADQIFQRIGTSATVSLSGAITGATVTGIKYRLYAALTSDVLKDWTSVDNLTINASTGTWSGAPIIPQGGMYRIAVQSLNGTTVVATSATSSTVFGVGDLFACIGSSSAEKWFQSASGTGFTPSANIRKFDGTWSPFSNVGAAIIMANKFAALSGVPVGMLNYGAGGSTLGNWLSDSYAQWKTFVSAVAATGSKLAGVLISVGSNDASYGQVASRASHLANLRSLESRVRALTGQSLMPVLISGFNRRSKYDASLAVYTAGADYVRMAENDAGDDPKVCHVQTLDFELSTDGIHLTPAGFTASCVRNAEVFGPFVYSGVYLRGPKISQISVGGNVGTVKLTHRGSSDIDPASGITGFTALDADGTPVAINSAVRTDASTITLTCASAPAKIQYLEGGFPAVGTPVYGNTVPALPMHVETDMVVTYLTDGADTTAPNLTGSVTATSVTQTTASITWPAATDNVAVTGYEYSINGGTSYVSVGTITAVSLMGLTAGTTYALRVRAVDAAGNKSPVINGTLITAAAPDTTAPTMSGTISVSNTTQTTSTISWNAGSDNVAVTGYEYSINGGASYAAVGTNLTASLTGLTAGTTYQLRVRAFDAAGNKSNPLSATLTTTQSAVSFTPSALRTLRVLATSKLFDVTTPGYWDMSNTKRPKGAKDPQATLDITFDWSDWLADVNNPTIAGANISLVGLQQAGVLPDGAKVTVFITGGAVNVPASLTCTITTATTPARVEERTVSIVIEEQ